MCAQRQFRAYQRCEVYTLKSKPEQVPAGLLAGHRAGTKAGPERKEHGALNDMRVPFINLCGRLGLWRQEVRNPSSRNCISVRQSRSWNALALGNPVVSM